jgi:hypothetical protein
MVSRYRSAVHYAALGEGDDADPADMLPDGHRAGSSYTREGVEFDVRPRFVSSVVVVSTVASVFSLTLILVFLGVG